MRTFWTCLFRSSRAESLGDRWGPLIGPGKLFDPTRFFIVCANVLGSPYGSSSPCTRSGGEPSTSEPYSVVAPADTDWDGSGWWGPEFPSTSVRDDVRVQKALLDFLGVEQIAAVVGGSMGGMAVLEWPLCFPTRYSPAQANPDEPQKPYIRALVPIATAAFHSAWGISWAEAQRQSIYSDPDFDHGYYKATAPPRSGLAAARMAALLTYRSRESFESRFGRRTGNKKGKGAEQAKDSSGHAATASRAELEKRGSIAAIEHNEGNTSSYPKRAEASAEAANHHAALQNGIEQVTQAAARVQLGDSSANTTGDSVQTPPAPLSPRTNGTSSTQASSPHGLATGAEPSIGSTKIFSAQSYLRYQGDKFVKRFDANCYVHLTRKMDQHDVARDRDGWGKGLKAEEKEWAGFSNLQKGAFALGNAHSADGPNSIDRHDGEEQAEDAARRVLGSLSLGKTRYGAPPPRVLVVSIESDGLFAPPEQHLIHDSIEGSQLAHVVSPDGHDGFLLEFEQINSHVERFLRAVLVDDHSGPSIYDGNGVGWAKWKDWNGTDTSQQVENGIVGGATSKGPNAKVKESVFGEVEDVTRW